jgi:hypothetical protein
MSIVELIINGKLDEAKENLFLRLNEIAANKLEDAKQSVGENFCEPIEEEFDLEIDIDEEPELLDEAVKSRNVIRQGRIMKIRRRIRRNKKGKIVVQRNVRKSAVKGFRISGNKVVRIPAIQRIQKARKLKRYWKTKGKAKLNRTLLKRKMSLRRRKSMGIR